MNLKVGNGLLIIISGPSGVGKGTIREELMKDKNISLFYSVSMTTRKKRPGEENGREYYFVTRDEFDRNIESGNLLEWTEYVGNKYGTPKDKIIEMLEKGNDVLLEIDIKGASSVIEKMPEALSIFIAPPSLEELENRIRGRSTETEDVIQNRMLRAKQELEYKRMYKYIVLNDSVNKAVDKIKKIIEENRK